MCEVIMQGWFLYSCGLLEVLNDALSEIQYTSMTKICLQTLSQLLHRSGPYEKYICIVRFKSC